LARRSSCRHRRTSRHRRDGRDNIFTPNKGVLAAVAEAELRWNITAVLGADRLRRRRPNMGARRQLQRSR